MLLYMELAPHESWDRRFVSSFFSKPRTSKTSWEAPFQTAESILCVWFDKVMREQLQVVNLTYNLV